MYICQSIIDYDNTCNTYNRVSIFFCALTSNYDQDSLKFPPQLSN